MRAVNEFIVEVGKAFNNTLKHGDLELYVDHRARQQEQSNRKGIVTSLPIKGDTGEIEIGAEVIIDPTVLFEQSYRGETQKSQFIVDEEKGRYRLMPNLVLAYKNPGQTEYTGFQQSVFVEMVETLETERNGIILPVAENQTEQVAKVLISNEELLENDIKAGDQVYVQKNVRWLFEVDDKKMMYMRTPNILGKRLNHE